MDVTAHAQALFTCLDMESDTAHAAMAEYRALRDTDTDRFIPQLDALVRAESACAGAATISAKLAALAMLDAEAAVSVASLWDECLQLTRGELEHLPQRADCSGGVERHRPGRRSVTCSPSADDATQRRRWPR
jgi:hypothetical protein